jgi:proteasome lid subunit RPN8/RPN11
VEDLRAQGWTYRRESAFGCGFWERKVEGEEGTVERRYDDAGQTTRVIAYPVGLGEVAPVAAHDVKRSASAPVPTSALVSFSPQARQQIAAGANWGTSNDREQRETGGVLLGHVTGSRVEVVAARTRASGRTPNSVTLDLSEGHGQLGLVAVGDWHSHPDDDATPSETDRSSWDRAFRRARSETAAPFWVCCIAAAPRFREPILRFWVCDLDGIRPFTIDD